MIKSSLEDEAPADHRVNKLNLEARSRDDSSIVLIIFLY